MALVLNPAEFQTKYLAISYKIKVEPIKCYPFFIVPTFLKWKLLQKVYLQTCHRSIKLTFDTKGFPLSLLFFTQLNNWWHVQSTVKRLPCTFSRWSSKTLSQSLNVNGFLPWKSIVAECGFEYLIQNILPWSSFSLPQYIALRKIWSFQLRISSVNVTKSVGNCEFGHICWRNP